MLKYKECLKFGISRKVRNVLYLVLHRDVNVLFLEHFAALIYKIKVPENLVLKRNSGTYRLLL